MTTRPRIGRVGWRVKFGVLAVTALAMLLSAVACDRQSVVTEEPAVTQEPDATRESAVTQRPATTAEPVATPQRIIREKVENRVEVHRSAEGSRIPPCGRAVAHIWGNRGGGVVWRDRGLAGDEIVFTQGLEVYVVGVDGRGLRMISDLVDEGAPEDGTTTLDVSPDGREVVYAPCERLNGGDGDWTNHEQELAAASLDGGQVWRLTDNWHFDKYPSWSPDGQRIAFVSSGELSLHAWSDVHLYTMAADGTDVRKRAEGPLVHDTPQWSPDGDRIAYAKFDDRGMGGRPPEIYIYAVAADGGRAQRLMEAVSGPSWSPDGERIAYAKADGDEIALYTIGADGTDERRLAEIDGWQPGRGEPDPTRTWIEKVSWSPDGSQILVLANERAYPGIQIIAADGSGSELVDMWRPSPNSIQDATWSPDGTRIAMVGVFRGHSAQIALLAIGADGADPRVLASIEEDGELVGLGVERGDVSAELAACREGVAVPDPDANPGLVEDCEALLVVQNVLAGPGKLNWLVDTDIRDWEGVVVQGTPPRVRELALVRRSLVGEIPTELNRLTELRVLNMSRNALMGEIPAELGELENLETIALSRNYLSGEMPSELGELSKLTGLALNGNNLEGEIPAQLGRLTSLRGLNLSSNRLSGEIPAELGRLSDLGYLNLSHNDLAGEIPAELGGLRELTHIHLSHNDLTGEVPAELGQLSGLKELNLSRNELTGGIPAELGDLKNLEDLFLHENQLSREIPAELGELKNLVELNLARNNLSGSIPTDLARLPDLDELYLFGNEFTGCIPEELRRVRYNDLADLELPVCE